MKTPYAVAAIAFAACSALYAPTNTYAADDGRTAAEKIKDGTVDAANKTGDAMKNAADKVTGTVDNPNGNDANRMTGNNTGPGNTAMAPDAEDMKGVLADATEAFAKKGTFDDLIERFVDADRNRIGKDRYAEQDHADLNAAVDSFQAAWKAKYNKDFDIADEKVVFNDPRFKFIQGEISDAAQPAGGAVNIDAKVGDAEAKTRVENKTGMDMPNNAAADANRNDAGRNIATVTVSPGAGQADIQVPLIHEMPDSWRIDVPDSVDGPKLKDNVVAHLNALTAMKDQWPADANEAYRIVGTHMLMAVLNKPAAMQ